MIICWPSQKIPVNTSLKIDDKPKWHFHHNELFPTADQTGSGKSCEKQADLDVFKWKLCILRRSWPGVVKIAKRLVPSTTSS